MSQNYFKLMANNDDQDNIIISAVVLTHVILLCGMNSAFQCDKMLNN